MNDSVDFKLIEARYQDLENEPDPTVPCGRFEDTILPSHEVRNQPDIQGKITANELRSLDISITKRIKSCIGI